MTILFITPYFPPEVGAPQTRIYELAVRLVKLGHEVTVLTTFPNYPTGRVPKEWRGKLHWSGVQDGIRIHRIWTYTAPNRGFLKRILHHLSFALTSSIAGVGLPGCDAMVVESPPLFDGFAGVLLSSIKHSPYVFMVSDLWPESAVQMGVLRNSQLIWASKQIESLFYRRAAAVLALTTGIRDKIVAGGVQESKVVLFRNSVDCNFFRSGIDGTQLRRKFCAGENDFMVLYAGTFGLAQNLMTVLEAAALSQHKGDAHIQFVLVGDGAESDVLRAKAHSLCLNNLRFVSSLPKARMPELLNAADCVLVPLRRLEIFRGALPTKMYEAMACGRPVILGIEGEAEQLIHEANAGCCVPPEDPGAIRKAVLSLMSDRERAQRLGANGHHYVATHFSRDTRANELSELLCTIAGAGSPKAAQVEHGQKAQVSASAVNICVKRK